MQVLEGIRGLNEVGEKEERQQSPGWLRAYREGRVVPASMIQWLSSWASCRNRKLDGSRCDSVTMQGCLIGGGTGTRGGDEVLPPPAQGPRDSGLELSWE